MSRDYSGVSVEEVDGTTRYTFSASWLGSFTSCPESARLEMVGQMPRIEADYMATGTAAHAAYEFVLSSWMEYPDSKLPAVEDSVYCAQEEFSDLMAGPDFVWSKYDEPKARQFIDTTVRTWYADVLPQLTTPLGVETKFEVQLASDASREIWLRGTIDSAEDARLNDWKTSNKAWKDELWQKKRWDIQSTVYTYAWNVTMREPEFLPWVDQFVFWVMLPNGASQQVPVTRDHRHFDWLRTRCWQIADLVDADIRKWPLLDDSWKCSPKWCGAFASCKGLAWGGSAPW